jgi:hypothetical protein
LAGLPQPVRLICLIAVLAASVRALVTPVTTKTSMASHQASGVTQSRSVSGMFAGQHRHAEPHLVLVGLGEGAADQFRTVSWLTSSSGATSRTPLSTNDAACRRNSSGNLACLPNRVLLPGCCRVWRCPARWGHFGRRPTPITDNADPNKIKSSKNSDWTVTDFSDSESSCQLIDVSIS